MASQITKTLSDAIEYVYAHAIELMEEGRYEDPVDAVQHAWESWDEYARRGVYLKAELLEQMKPEQQALQFVKQIADLDFEGDFASAQEARSVAVMLLGLIEQARAIVAPLKES
jgi:tetratricopeptide (TPR) repeat protein